MQYVIHAPSQSFLPRCSASQFSVTAPTSIGEFEALRSRRTNIVATITVPDVSPNHHMIQLIGAITNCLTGAGAICEAVNERGVQRERSGKLVLAG